MLALDLHDVGCDSWPPAPKWFMGPKEMGILYVRNGRAPDIWPNTIGYTGDIKVELDLQNALKFETLGQRDDAAIAALGETADLHAQIRPERIQAWSRNSRVPEGLKDARDPGHPEDPALSGAWWSSRFRRTTRKRWPTPCTRSSASPPRPPADCGCARTSTTPAPMSAGHRRRRLDAGVDQGLRRKADTGGSNGQNHEGGRGPRVQKATVIDEVPVPEVGPARSSSRSRRPCATRTCMQPTATGL